MNNENTDKPKPTPPNGKVFDVMRPGKAPASPSSRPVIVGHKPQVQDDQFVPGDKPSRLAGDPNEKRDLMNTDKKVSLAPVSSDLAPSAPPVRPAGEAPAEPTEATPAADAVPESEVSSPAPAESAAPMPSTAPELETVPTDIAPAEPAPSMPQASEQQEKPTPEHLAVEQLVDADEVEAPATPQPEAPITSEQSDKDDVLAETGAPLLQESQHAVVSHHKHHVSWWEWLLIFLLIVIIALTALNFLLDAGIITTNFNLPHTDLL